jgi:hypothetical protein
MDEQPPHIPILRTVDLTMIALSMIIIAVVAWIEGFPLP